MDDVLHTDYLPVRTLVSAGKEYLYFSGTSYLGMARNEALQAYLQEGLSRYGSNYSSTRLSNVQLNIYAEAENYLAALTGAEAALTISSGFLAGQTVIRTLEGSAHFIYGPRTHPALWRRKTDSFDGSFTDWVQQLPEVVEKSKQEHIVILCNSLDPLLAVKYNFDWLQDLPVDKPITIIIDDSHGFGVTGKEGAGIYSEVKVPAGAELMVVTSMGKGLGIPAGLILGKEKTLANFRQSPFFGGGSPAIPAYLYAFLQAATIYPQARQQLLENIRLFQAQLTNPTLLHNIPNYPVFYTPQNQLCPFLYEKDMLISSFSYPSPQSSPITRIILNSLHTPDDLNKLAAAINAFAWNI
ncbi:MAG: class I and II aminotransferase [Cytophagales bacterium CG18_big_fil_WC_8_21_14_2_50_42_9]|nr:MAG: class I and II aminotransferase [Cytophagales bacterium CG18_big_fil_WC_8_21_14_2_50_42_9]